MKHKLLYTFALLITAACVFRFTADIQRLTAQNATLTAQNAALQQTISTLQATVDKQRQTIAEMAEEQREAQKTDRGGERERKVMEVTAYWEGSCGKKPTDPLYGITASGKYVQEGYIAAWTKEYPIGTKLYIPYFDRVFTVMDTGGDITEGRLDVYMTSAKECFKFGRKWLEVWEVE